MKTHAPSHCTRNSRIKSLLYLRFLFPRTRNENTSPAVAKSAEVSLAQLVCSTRTSQLHLRRVGPDLGDISRGRASTLIIVFLDSAIFFSPHGRNSILPLALTFMAALSRMGSKKYCRPARIKTNGLARPNVITLVTSFRTAAPFVTSSGLTDV